MKNGELSFLCYRLISNFHDSEEISQASVITTEYFKTKSLRMISAVRTSAQRALLTSHQCQGIICTHNQTDENHSGNYHHHPLSCSQRRSYATKTKAKTYYQVLGISPRSTQAEIKGAYYKLSKIHHPDITKNEDDNIIFAEISEAYSVLGNRQSRRKYDTGMLRSDDIFSPGTGAVSEAEYREFMRQRGQFARRAAAPTGRSPIYNYDKFYEMHYGPAVKNQSSQKKNRSTVDAEIRATKMKYYSSIGFSVVFLSAMLFILK